MEKKHQLSLSKHKSIVTKLTVCYEVKERHYGKSRQKNCCYNGGVRSYWGSVAIADLLEEEGRAVVKEINSSGGAVKF